MFPYLNFPRGKLASFPPELHYAQRTFNNLVDRINTTKTYL